MSNIVTCPICGTQAEKNTFCPTCQWFLVGSLDAVSLSPIPQSDLDAINASLKAYRQGWQTRKEQQKEKDNAEHQQILKELKSLRAAVTALEKRIDTPTPAPVQSPLVVPAARPLSSHPAVAAMSVPPASPMSDFKISNGVVTQYLGKSSQVRIPDGIHTIGEKAFNNCRTVKTIYLPDSVLIIEPRAFFMCTVEEIRLPPVLTRLDTSVFYHCLQLTTVHMPQQLLKIPSFLFDGCTALVNITLPDGLQVIDSGAFRGCTALQKMVVPNSVATIGSDAFKNCTGLQKNNSLYLPAHLENRRRSIT